MTTATTVSSQYGSRNELVRYRSPDGAERIVFARRVRGAVRVMDQIAGECLSDRRYLVASRLHRADELKRVVADWLTEQAEEVLWTSEMLT